MSEIIRLTDGPLIGLAITNPFGVFPPPEHIVVHAGEHVGVADAEGLDVPDGDDWTVYERTQYSQLPPDVGPNAVRGAEYAVVVPG